MTRAMARNGMDSGTNVMTRAMARNGMDSGTNV